MRVLTDLTSADIERMSYNELIGLVRETNRPPGGGQTIRFVADATMLNFNHTVLDIGTSTGYSALELNRLSGCSVVGIDINDTSILEAQRRADVAGALRVNFRIADTQALPFSDSTFDVVFCGNVTALVSDPIRAMSEYSRVLRRNGYLVAVPMYYIDMPTPELVERVRSAIKVNIPILYRAAAVAPFITSDFQVWRQKDYRFDSIPPTRITEFCTELLSRPHLGSLKPQTLEALRRVYSDYMTLFRENLSMMGFSVLILRKSALIEDSELFTAAEIN